MLLQSTPLKLILMFFLSWMHELWKLASLCLRLLLIQWMFTFSIESEIIGIITIVYITLGKIGIGILILITNLSIIPTFIIAYVLFDFVVSSNYSDRLKHFDFKLIAHNTQVNIIFNHFDGDILLSSIFPADISVLYWLAYFYILNRVASSNSYLFNLHSSAFIIDGLKIWDPCDLFRLND